MSDRPNKKLAELAQLAQIAGALGQSGQQQQEIQQRAQASRQAAAIQLLGLQQSGQQHADALEQDKMQLAATGANAAAANAIKMRDSELDSAGKVYEREAQTMNPDKAVMGALENKLGLSADINAARADASTKKVAKLADMMALLDPNGKDKTVQAALAQNYTPEEFKQAQQIMAAPAAGQQAGDIVAKGAQASAASLIPTTNLAGKNKKKKPGVLADVNSTNLGY